MTKQEFIEPSSGMKKHTLQLAVGLLSSWALVLLFIFRRLLYYAVDGFDLGLAVFALAIGIPCVRAFRLSASPDTRPGRG